MNRRARLMVSLICLALAGVWTGAEPVAQAPVQNNLQIELWPNTPYSGKLTGKTATFHFRVEANQYFTLQLDNPATDVALFLSQGRVGRSVGCFYKRSTLISEVSTTGGEYTVELRPCGSDFSGLLYGLKFSQPRRATERDLAGIAAQRA